MDSKNFSLTFSNERQVCIAEFGGYLAAGVASALIPEVERLLSEGYNHFLFDFAGVSMLESAAVAALLMATEKIVDDSQGYLSFCCLNEVSQRVLEMVGVFLYAGCFATRTEAIAEMAS